jgi:hypothetical protein
MHFDHLVDFCLPEPELIDKKSDELSSVVQYLLNELGDWPRLIWIAVLYVHNSGCWLCVVANCRFGDWSDLSFFIVTTTDVTSRIICLAKYNDIYFNCLWEVGDILVR